MFDNKLETALPNLVDFPTTIAEEISPRDEVILDSIIADLTSYDIYDIIARISSLNLMIENQNKSTLLDALIAGILARPRSSYTGKAVMSNGKFRSIINRLETMGLKMMVDPAENAFIERVRYYGNYWIFPGINYSPAHTLQGFLDVLCLRDLQFNKSFTRKAHRLINFVLQISDATAHMLGYNLDTIDHVEQSNIKLPDSRQSEQLKNCVLLKYSFIEELIDDEDVLQWFLIDFKENSLSKAVTGNFQDFFTHPFLKVDEETVVLLNPSILVPFAIHHLILLADAFGCKKLLIDSYNDQIWRECKKDLQELGHKKVLESEYGIELINNRHRKELIMTVGNNKLLFVHFICDDGADYDGQAMFGQHTITEDIPATRSRVKYFVEKLPKAEETNIYQLVIPNTFGRTIGYETTKGEALYSISLSPYELHCISINERDREEFIPRYINAKRRLKWALPPMMASELNSIEIYTSNDYSFYLSDNYDPTTTITYFGPGDSLDYVIRAEKKENRHLVSSYDGIHLCDVVLNDPIRNIYFTKGMQATPPELVVKFRRINIWFTAGTITSQEKANILFSIIDTISFWLAEAKEIVDGLSFQTDAIRIHIDLCDPTVQYYNIIEDRGDFLSGIEYSWSGNTLNMMWHATSYQHLGEKTNGTEKALLTSVLGELAKLNQSKINLCLLDNLFINPVKKKVYEINTFHTPYLVPTSGRSPSIPPEEEHHLLDEIGTYFLTLPGYDYGQVPDKKRVELTNSVVGYLYSLLQAEIASINSTALYEKVLFDLESVLPSVLLVHKRYIYDAACYPEKAASFVARYSELNKVSVALKFLAEYIAAVPPSGKKYLGTMQYDRILAICSLIVDWGYKNDLFFYHILNTPVAFLKSGRIGISNIKQEYLNQINASATIKRIESFSDPRIPVYSPLKLFSDFQEAIDEAFNDEYGFTFQQYARCIIEIANFGDTIKSDVKRVDRKVLVSKIAQACYLSTECINSIVNLISLGKRDNFLIPPDPFRKEDVYPWRYNRELSFTRRPIIQRDNELLWGNRQLHHMLQYTVDLIVEGKFKARRPKLKQLIGKLSNIRGKEFNTLVYQKLNSIGGLIVQERVSKINGKKIVDANGNSLGDIDVLYIIPDKQKIVVGEVKEFSFAKNPYEMDQEYKRIFVDGDKPCYMTKHKRRVAWIQSHLEDVKVHFGLSDGKWSVKPVMFVSNDIVSNKFYHQNEPIIVYSQIDEKNVKSI